MAVHRPTLFNLMNSIVGVSVLAIPFCFHQCGIILGSLAMLLMMYFTKKTCSLLLLSAQLARRRSYESLAQFTYSDAGKLGVEACIIGLMAGTLCAFNVIIGDLGPSIIHDLFAIEITPSIRATMMIVLAFGVGLPLSLMRDISSLANLSAVSLMFYATFVVQVILNSLPHLLSGEWITTINLWKPAGFLQSLSIFALAFSCQTQLFGLYDSLPEPSVKKMDGVVNVGMNGVCCVYLSVGFFSYVTFYDDGIKGDILTNYGSSFLATLLKMGFCLSVIVSFPLMVFPMRASINSLLFPSQTAGTENMPGGPGYMPQNRFVYITVTVISLTLMVGILIPQIEFILGLTGATMGTIISMILPASMFLQVVQETKGEHRTMAKIVLGVGFVCLIASTYTTLTSTQSHHDGATPVNKVNPDIKPSLEHLQPNVKIPSNLSDLKAVQSPPTVLTITKDNPADTKEIKADEKKINEKDKEVEKRIEPALPHAPDEKKEAAVDKGVDAAKGVKNVVEDKEGKGMEKAEKGADPLNEKRQLMSTDDSKGSEPVKLARSGESNLLSAKRENKQPDASNVNKSNNMDSKSLKKPDSREKRDLDEKPTTSKMKITTGNGMGKDESIGKAATSAPVVRVTELSKNSSVIIVEPKSLPVKTSSTTESTAIEASSADPRAANETGKVIKGRDLKSSEVIGRKLNSVQPQRSIWEQRLKKRGSFRIKRDNKNKLDLS